jgi:hypothetical protein
MQRMEQSSRGDGNFSATSTFGHWQARLVYYITRALSNSKTNTNPDDFMTQVPQGNRVDYPDGFRELLALAPGLSYTVIDFLLPRQIGTEVQLNQPLSQVGQRSLQLRINSEDQPFSQRLTEVISTDIRAAQGAREHLNQLATIRTNNQDIHRPRAGNILMDRPSLWTDTGFNLSVTLSEDRVFLVLPDADFLHQLVGRILDMIVERSPELAKRLFMRRERDGRLKPVYIHFTKLGIAYRGAVIVRADQFAILLEAAIL